MKLRIRAPIPQHVGHLLLGGNSMPSLENLTHMPRGGPRSMDMRINAKMQKRPQEGRFLAFAALLETESPAKI